MISNLRIDFRVSESVLILRDKFSRFPDSIFILGFIFANFSKKNEEREKFSQNQRPEQSRFTRFQIRYLTSYFD